MAASKAGGAGRGVTARPSSRPLAYRGSPKHKRRPARGRKGTRCPEWSHEAAGGRLGTDIDGHPWEETVAAVMLASSTPDPDGSGRRFATERGMAFVAHDTEEGTWHGYPVPWNDVPATLKDRWRAEKRVSRRDLTRYGEFARSDIDWPLASDHD